MAHPTDIYLFGDQTVDCSHGLAELLRRPKGPMLSRFLDEAYSCLREATHDVDFHLKKRLARCSSLEDFVQETSSQPALQQALTCIYHLACFIQHCEQHEGQYPDPEQSILVGLCTGAFAAAVIGCCRTLSELIPVATHAVKVAFNTGVCAHVMGETLEHSSVESSASAWSFVVLGLSIDDARQILRQFTQETGLPLTSQPWVSAASYRGVTISGPPGVLAQLQRFPALSGRKVVNASVFAPYHAAHIFDEAAVQSVLHKSQSEIFARNKFHIPVMSVSSGAVRRSGDAYSTLQTAISDSLTKVIRLDKVFDNLLAGLDASGTTAVTIFAIATGTGQTLRSSIISHIGLKDIVATVETLTGSSQLPNEYTEGESRRPKLAIVGFSGRFPEADTLDEYWNILVQGLDIHKPVPDFHWDVKTHVDVEGKRKNTSATPYGCWLKQPGAFDANFFNMSPREAPQVDPAQRIALMTAYEAMENAGMVPDATPSSKRDRDTYYMPGGNRAFIPGRINYFFKYTGPSYSVDTACSSSLASFHLACNALWAGEVDTAFAGGCNIVTNPDLTAGLDRGHFLSRTGNCKTFDETADGYCRAEGVVTVIVKRLTDAIHDHDPIHAVIRGASTNHSSEADSITRPYVGAQKAVFRKILHIAGVDPVDVDYVEMHGTGTKTGDPGEMKSVLDVFAPSVPLGRRSEQPLHIGSVKPNIGHMEAASGLSSLVKVLMMLKNNVIVPHTGIKTRLNPNFPEDMAARQVFIPRELKPWPRPNNATRKVFVNNFSAAGGNSGLLLEDAPSLTHTFSDPRSHFPVAVSAKSTAALQRNLRRLLQYVEAHGSEGGFLPALSYTTTARRTHYQYRSVVSGSNIAQIAEELRGTLASEQHAERVRTKPKVIFAFTGQGSQYTGMGKFYIDTFASFREDLTRIDSLARRQGFPSFLPVLTGEADVESQGPVVVQLSIVSLEIALARLWILWGVEATCVVGHSLGEYAALCVSGVLSIADTLYLVGRRAQMLEKHCSSGSHAMLAVKASVQMIEAILATETLDIACINGPRDTVLAGPARDIAQAQQKLTEARLKSVLVKVPFAFHSAQVDPILDELVEVANGVRYSEPKLPVMCPLTGSVNHVHGVTFDAEYFRQHCRKPVDMLGAIRTAQSSGIIDDGAFMLEIGPHPVVCGMFTATIEQGITGLPSLGRGKDTSRLIVEALSALYLAGAAVDWQEYNRGRPYEVLALPNYSWDLKDYWIQYVNDWSLYKGEPVYRADLEPGMPKTAEQDRCVTRLETTAVHTIVLDNVGAAGGELIVDSDLSRPDFNPVVRGHKVEGHNLCTPSVYAEIALTVGQYIFSRQGFQSDGRSIEIANFAIKRPLVTDSAPSQILRTTVSLQATNNHAFCKFTTADAVGKATIEHASCTIRLSKEVNTMEDVAMIDSRVAALWVELSKGQAFNFNRSMAYRMVSDFVVVEPTFRGLESLLLNSSSMDACGTVDFTGLTPAPGDFEAHPAVLDAFTQLPGFIMNANERADMQHEVFLNQGWRSMRLLKPISATKKYRTYAKMQDRGKGLWQGDLTVLDGADSVVALFTGFTLRAVPRQLLKYVFAGDVDTAAGTEDGPTTGRIDPDSSIGERASGPDIISEDTIGGDVGCMGVKIALTTASPLLEQTLADRMDHTTKPENFQSTVLERTGGRVLTDQDSRTGTSGGDMADVVLRIISEESGIAVETFSDESRFDDLGVDSFLSLLIVSRLEVETKIGLNAPTFTRMATVRDLRDFIRVNKSSSTVATGSSASSTVLRTDPSATGSGAITPVTEMEECEEGGREEVCV